MADSMTPRKKDIPSGGVSVSGSIQIRLKHSMVGQHFSAARFFAECTAELETKLLSSESQDETKKSQHSAYAIGAVVSAVMGIEAYINEIYLCGCDKDKNRLAGLDDREMNLLAEWWPRLERRADILLKYQHALLLLGRAALSKGKNPYQDADSLIQLRNALTHYKSEWDDACDVHAKLEARLTGRFSLNPLAVKSPLWFPHHCLSSGCAKWAVSTAEVFVSEFCAKLGIPKRI